MSDSPENNEPQSTISNCAEAWVGIAQQLWDAQFNSVTTQITTGKTEDLQKTPEILAQTSVQLIKNFQERSSLTTSEYLVLPALPVIHALGNVLYDRNHKSGS